MVIEARKASDNPQYEITDIRFEHESGGYMTVWFNIGGAAFAEPEAMKNLYVGFDELMECLPSAQKRFKCAMPQRQTVKPGIALPIALDWHCFLRGYIDQCVDLRAEEKMRLGWMQERLKRSNESSGDGVSDLIVFSEEEISPTWDDVAHAVINSLNDTAVELYPELLDCDPEYNEQLREVLESHGERLANQLYALARSVRQARGN
jgi:hypothetical protein